LNYVSTGRGCCMAINLDVLIIGIIVRVIILSPVLWISGRLLVGKEKAKFTDALWIVILGTLIGEVFGALFTGTIASIIVLVIWLALVKHFFDCGWLRALAINILTVLIYIVIVVVLVLIGLATWGLSYSSNSETVSASFLALFALCKT